MSTTKKTAKPKPFSTKEAPEGHVRVHILVGVGLDGEVAVFQPDKSDDEENALQELKYDFADSDVPADVYHYVLDLPKPASTLKPGKKKMKLVSKQTINKPEGDGDGKF